MNQRVAPIAGLLFFSGMCALVYQIAWLRELRMVFGSSTTATAAVLAIFMGGLGVGNAWLGHRADVQPNPLRFYAVLEGLVAIACAMSPWLIDLSRSVYVALGGQLVLGVTAATLARLTLSVLVLGVPTFLMGGTLPAAGRAATDPADINRRGVATLYGVNTLGAVCGAAVSTFFLLEALGTRDTLWLACSINAMVAVAAWGLSAWSPAQAQPDSQAKRAGREQRAKGRRRREKAAPATVDPPADEGPSQTQETGLPAGLVYAASGGVGFAFFLMELVWYRMLGPILGGTTFTFGLILAVALAGMGIGGALFAFLFRRQRITPELFAFTCGLEALAIAYPYALGDRIAVLAYVLQDMSVYGFGGQVLGWTAVCALVVLPAAIVSGVQFPALIALAGSGRKDVGKQVGLTFAANTVGAIVGSLAGGFGILPLLSAPGTWIAVVLLLAGLGAAALVASRRQVQGVGRYVVPVGCAALACLCLLASGPTAVWRHSGIGARRAGITSRTRNGLRDWMHLMRRATVWEADGVEVGMGLTVVDGVAVVANGKSDGNALGDADSFAMPGLLGGLLHPRAVKGLVVGLATGETAGWMADIPTMERVDVVELEPRMVELARRCAPVNRNVLEHPKVRLIFGDAREVLLTSPQRYDLIVSQPSNPYRAGVATLFTREYYAAIKQRLEPGGIFIQWMQGYEVDAPTVALVWATLASEFAGVEIWQTNPFDFLLVCSPEPIPYEVARLRERVAQEPYKTALRDIWQTDDLEGVLARYVADSSYVTRVVERSGGVVNTDDRNLLEYASARTVGRQTGFSIDNLRQRAVACQGHRPRLSGGDVDWQRVEDQRLMMYFLRQRKLPKFQPADAAQQRRADALASYLQGDFAGVVAGWSDQPRAPHYPVELGILGHAYGVLGDARAGPVLEELAQFNPVDASALRAIGLYQQGKLKEAGELARATFVGLRTNPWAKLVEQTFGMAVEIARKDPQQTSLMYQSLAQPFALYFIEEKRLMTRFELAQMLGPETLVDYLEPMEPYVPWTQKFLEARAEAYQAASHPRLAQAQRDLEAFLANASRGTLLPAKPGSVALGSR